VAAQIVARDHNLDKFLAGTWRFLLGLARKVLIANPLGAVADTVFSQNLDTLPMPYAWVGILCYAFQIYFDFAGYSDMAIGLGRMFGFEFIENFERPYTSRSITEFWRRWHMTLSNFMRDPYIPLAATGAAASAPPKPLSCSSCRASGTARAELGQLGAYHALLVERMLGLKRLARSDGAGHAADLGLARRLVMFRAATLGDALHVLCRLFAWSWAT
jgi:hypothetical protein